MAHVVHLEHSEVPCDSERRAIATLWAIAKSATPEVARLWRGLDGWASNEHMREATVPEDLAELVVEVLADWDATLHERYLPDVEAGRARTIEDVVAEAPPGWRVEARGMTDLHGQMTRRVWWSATHPHYRQGRRPVGALNGSQLLFEMWRLSVAWASESALD